MKRDLFIVFSYYSQIQCNKVFQLLNETVFQTPPNSTPREISITYASESALDFQLEKCRRKLQKGPHKNCVHKSSNACVFVRYNAKLLKTECPILGEYDFVISTPPQSCTAHNTFMMYDAIFLLWNPLFFRKKGQLPVTKNNIQPHKTVFGISFFFVRSFVRSTPAT